MRSASWVSTFLSSKTEDTLTILLVAVTAQLWSIATTTLQCRFKIQLNTMLYAKTLLRKDIASSLAAPSVKKDDDAKSDAASEKQDDQAEFSSKAQIMTLMTTDVDRVSDFSWHFFSLIGIFVSLRNRFLISLVESQIHR